MLLTQIVLLCLLFSCKKSSDSALNETLGLQKTNSKIENVLNLSNVEERKLAYNLLDQNDKYTLWTNHLKSILATKKLNEKQKAIVIDLITTLNSELFVSGKQTELTKLRDPWLVQAQSSFSSEEIREMAYVFTDGGSTTNGIGPDPIDDKPSCNCNMNSWFTCDSESLCPTKGASCKTGNGCGFLGQYDCNNICYKF
ncbi:bacteriocin fulvocin C-related protein [Pedobacter fastidiosus]